MKDTGRETVGEIRDIEEIRSPDEGLDPEADVDTSQQNIKPRKRRAA
jgi:hypothetical protein